LFRLICNQFIVVVVVVELCDDKIMNKMKEYRMKSGLIE